MVCMKQPESQPLLLNTVVMYTPDNLKKSHLKNIVRRYDISFVGYVNKIPFLMLWNSIKDTTKKNCYWWHMFNAFVPTLAVAFCTTNGKNKTRKCNIEGFIPVASLNVVVLPPSSFIKYLIGSTRNILSDVYTKTF